MSDVATPDDHVPDETLKGWFEEAREKFGKGRVHEAEAILARLIGLAPAHVPANALMTEVLFADRRIGEAEAFVTAALAGMPQDPRLNILRGNMLRARGLHGEAREVFLSVLTRDKSRLGAWSGLIAVAATRRDWPAVAGHLREGFAITRDAGLWRGAVEALLESGDSRLLADVAAVLPPPDVAQPGQFLPWARLLARVGLASRVVASLANFPASLAPEIRAEYHGLLADLAREAGDFPRALAERRQAVALLPGNRGLRRQLLRALLAVGDVDAAESELNALLASRAPQDDVAGEIQPLHEARMFRSAMQQLRSAFAAEESPSVSGLARIVAAEPGCQFAAVAFIAALRRHSLPAGGPGGGSPALPPAFWSLDAPDDTWRVHHPQSRWEAFAYAPLPADVEAALPVSPMALRRFPWDLQVDVLSMAVLWARGGWWFPALRACHGNLLALAGEGARLLFLVDEHGWLVPECIGCCAGEPVIARVRALQAGVLRQPSRVGDDRPHSAARLLTLAAAGVLAERILHGDDLADLRLLAAAEFRRRIA